MSDFDFIRDGTVSVGMTIAVALFTLLIGWLAGWIARSVAFFKDQDCCNPDHKESYKSIEETSGQIREDDESK